MAAGAAWRSDCPSAASTRSLASGLGRLARAAGRPLGGPAIYLSGELGAGKTTFCQGALRGAGCADAITSPGYLLAISHALRPLGALGEATALHVDLYRIDSAAAFDELGLEEAMADAALTLLEWPERAEPALPRPDVWIEVAADADSDLRRLVWRSASADGRALADAWARWAAAERVR